MFRMRSEVGPLSGVVPDITAKVVQAKPTGREAMCTVNSPVIERLTKRLITGNNRPVHGSYVGIGIPAGRAMNHTTVIPHHQIAIPPLMAVDEFIANLMCDQGIEELVGFRRAHALDSDCKSR